MLWVLMLRCLRAALQNSAQRASAPSVSEWKAAMRDVFEQGFPVNQNYNLEIAVVPRPPSLCLAVSGVTQASPPSFAQQTEREDTSGRGDQRGSCSGTWAAVPARRPLGLRVVTGTDMGWAEGIRKTVS